MACLKNKNKTDIRRLQISVFFIIIQGMISVVFPAYNEEHNVKELYFRLKKALDFICEEYEIIAVDNGSDDSTLERLKELSPIKIIVIARNIGQTAGLDAGINNANGDIIVLIDADLQNDPVDISALIIKLNEGYDVVSGWRMNRQDKIIRKIISRCANWLTYKITGLHLHDYGCALKAYRKEFLQNIVLYGETHAFLPAILFMRGARVAEIPVNHYPRKTGVSKISPSKLFKNIADLFAIRFLYHNMGRPMVFFGGWGFLSIVLGILTAIAAIILKLAHIRNLAQTPLPVVSSFLVITGFVLFMGGFLAEMITKMYFEDKSKKPYIVREIIKQ